ncbi:hypothetical protein Cni_G10315 [Canna indica]|uniref:Uncharacterized protein n=1 Tax=Canna indica TaxID=4628 RepID=A0AAQ3K6C1_9LILI|nr:hypothetical protein Cni_G10315 [Canna indica]
MTPKSQADPAWQHGRRLEKTHHWQCLHCDMISRGGGITRLKQYLAGGYPDVVNCSKVSSEVRKMFKAQLNNKKEERLKNAAQQADGDHYEARGGDYDEDAKFKAGIRASLEHQHYEREWMYYPGSQFEYGCGSGSGGISSVGSTSAIGAMDRSAKQQRIDDIYGKPKKWELGKAISKWFHLSQIPANAANKPYYRTMVSTIQKVGPASKTPIEIGHSKGKKKATPSKAKGKAKGKRSIDHLDAIAEAEEDEEDEPSVHSSSSTEDGGDDDDDGAGGEDTVVPSTLPPDDLWTNEQYFDHAT